MTTANDQLRELTRPQRRNKYNARKTEIDGHTFDSAMEARRFWELAQLVRAGEISDLELQPRYPIVWPTSGTDICNVVLDFRYRLPDGTIVIEDVKGRDNQLSRLKRKLVEAAHGIEVRIVTA